MKKWDARIKNNVYIDTCVNRTHWGQVRIQSSSCILECVDPTRMLRTINN